MLKNVTKFARILAVVVLMVGVTAPAAWAKVSHPKNAKWKSECGACHVAYSPRFLPSDSWRAIMSGLEDHFGSNAVLDAEDAKEISQFLEKNARNKRREDPVKPLLRITETHRFKSEHREISDSTWKIPKIKSLANCGACHPKAENDSFSEDDVRIPK